MVNSWRLLPTSATESTDWLRFKSTVDDDDEDAPSGIMRTLRSSSTLSSESSCTNYCFYCTHFWRLFIMNIYFVEFCNERLDDWHHHGSCGSVWNPHGKECRRHHKTQHQPDFDQMIKLFSSLSHHHRCYYHLGLAPTIMRTRRAIRLCKLQYSIVSATIRPPMNIILVSFM